MPESDARALVSDFINAISAFIGEEATETLLEISPVDVEVTRGDDRGEEGSIEEFLLEMSDEEGVATGRAAEHARVVAEALRSRAGRRDLERLGRRIEDEGILALFELSRGELTGPDPPAAGERTRSGE